MKAIRIMLLGIAIMIFGAAFVAANTETSFSETTYIGIALLFLGLFIVIIGYWKGRRDD